MKKTISRPVYRLDPAQVAKEAACSLGDDRLERRMVHIVSTMCTKPAASLPQLFPKDADSEAVYRLLRNERLSLGKVLRGHVAHTVSRARSLGSACVIHDTTEFSFPRKKRLRPGLQPHSAQRQGFFGHVSLCVSADGARAPLGCLRLVPFVRPERLRRAADRKDWQRQMGADFSEAGRWLKGIRQSERLLGEKTSAIHLIDREGDAYPLLAKLLAASSRFVVRLSQNRTLVSPDLGRMLDFLSAQPVLGPARLIALSERCCDERRPADKKAHPDRRARSAQLVIRSAKVTVCRPAARARDVQCPPTLTVHLVQVCEVDAPAGQTPVRWTLATSEPIDTPEACWRIVDLYRTRWLVEEFFKALKTGCAYESRQLDSQKTLLVLLGLCIPVAWTLLLMRYLEREAPDAPAEAVLPKALLGFLKRVWPRGSVPEQPTVREALLAIAALGGHLRHNGPPGWLVLHRGYQTLVTMYQGFRLASPEDRYDQP
jgi:hypothetical protein